MNETVWKPSVTVAAVVEQGGRFLLVEEHTRVGVRLNQPAGHLDKGESLAAAVVRETWEETAFRFVPRFLVGIYLWSRPDRDMTYLRFAFGGDLAGYDNSRELLDKGIIRALWMSARELQACRERHRSPLVERCVADYMAGHRHPLTVLTHFPLPTTV